MSIRWDSESDWDSADSETGVVHESAENTDFSDASEVRKGYSVQSPLYASSLVGYWPLQEDSGSTAYDFSGSDYDGAVNGPAQGVKGLLGTSSYSFDSSSSDYVSVTTPVNSVNTVTFSFWVYITTDQRWDTGTYGSERRLHMGYNKTDTEALVGVGTDYKFISVDLPLEQWHLFTVVGDSGTAKFYVDGEQIDTFNYSDDTPLNDFGIGRRYYDGSWGTRPLNGKMWDVRIYDRALQGSEVKELYDVVASKSNLTTSSKKL